MTLTFIFPTRLNIEILFNCSVDTQHSPLLSQNITVKLARYNDYSSNDHIVGILFSPRSYIFVLRQ